MQNRVIVALDVSTAKAAQGLIEDLSPCVAGFKVGLELISSGEVHETMRMISASRGRWFYDGKIHDIPNTVGKAVKEVVAEGAWMFNVHASAGVAAMQAAGASKGKSIGLAVTVLTSIDEEECNHIFGGPSKAKVIEFARDAKLAGLDGIICSPQELLVLGKRKELSGFLRVTPGIRPEWASAGDQQRVMTPGEAVRAGADYIVIGRPITEPPKEIGTPLEALLKINKEIEAAMAA